MRFITLGLAAFAVTLTLALIVIADPTTAPSNMLRDPSLDRINGGGGWQSSSLESASVSIAKDTTDPNHPALKATIDKVDGTDWHAQIYQSDLAVQKNAKYTLTLTAKASAARKIAVFIQEQDDPYSMLSDGQAVDLTADPQTQRVEITAKDDSDAVKLVIVVGDSTGTVTLSDMSLVKD